MSAPSAPRSFTVLSSLKWPAIAIGILAVVAAYDQGVRERR